MAPDTIYIWNNERSKNGRTVGCSMRNRIDGCNAKGGASYYIGHSERGYLASLEELASIVERGKVDSLHFNQRYILLPDIEEDTDVDKVLEALKDMHKMPMFHELPPADKIEETLSKGQLPTIYGIHPIDSFVFRGDLHLILDKRLYEVYGIKDTIPDLQEPCIEIGNEFICDAIRYCTNRYRTAEQVERSLMQQMLTYNEPPSDLLQ